MKNRNYFLTILSIILISCNNINNESSDNKDNVTVIKIEYVYDFFDVYKPKPILYSMLDTVILMTEKCMSSDEFDMIYCISAYKDSTHLLHISIELREQKRVYCKEIVGLFKYHDKIFAIYDRSILNGLFTNLNVKTNFKCQKENSLFYDHREDKKGSWHFIIEDEQSRFISCAICGEIWRDKQYHKSDSLDI